MSGIITNPHFRQYFEAPGAIEIGTMVAVLELGALGIHQSRLIFILWLIFLCSNNHCRWPSGRHHWPKGYPVHWCHSFYHRRCHSNIHQWFFCHGCRTNCQRFWRWAFIASIGQFDAPETRLIFGFLEQLFLYIRVKYLLLIMYARYAA